MKSKKSILVIATLLVLVAVTVCAVACNKELSVDKYVTKMYQSVDQMVKVTVTSKTSDKGVLVHEYTRDITVSGNNANVVTTEKALDTDMIGYKTTTNEQTVENFYRQSLLPIEFNESYLANATVSNGKLSATVNQVIATVMFGQTISPNGNVSITCQLDQDNRLQSINASYVNSNGKNVELSWTYAY